MIKGLVDKLLLMIDRLAKRLGIKQIDLIVGFSLLLGVLWFVLSPNTQEYITTIWNLIVEIGEKIFTYLSENVETVE